MFANWNEGEANLDFLNNKYNNIFKCLLFVAIGLHQHDGELDVPVLCHPATALPLSLFQDELS